MFLLTILNASAGSPCRTLREICARQPLAYTVEIVIIVERRILRRRPLVFGRRCCRYVSTRLAADDELQSIGRCTPWHAVKRIGLAEVLG